MRKDERILVLRLGALGDLILCFQAFAAIARAHPNARRALLTMPAFAGFARQMPWFDQVLVDPRAPRWRLDAWARLVGQVRRFAPTRVYDLQGKSRQSMLYGLLGGPLCGPEWSGAAPGCSHPRLWPPTPGMHYTDFVAAQLSKAGLSVEGVSVDLAWLDAPIQSLEESALEMPERFALLIPGCAANRLYKRWPVTGYAALANRLKESGLACAVLGTAADAQAIDELTNRAPFVLNLCGKTSLAQIAGLARQATLAVGNDTGPTHLVAAVGAPTLALMSDRVDPLWSCPKGPRAAWLQGNPLESLSLDDVWAKIVALDRGQGVV